MNSAKHGACRLIIAGLLLLLSFVSCAWAQAISFHSRRDYLAGALGESSQLAIADFNHDGNPDIVVAADQGGVAVLLGSANGAFSTPIPVAGSNDPFSVAVADFNGDGNPDFVVNSGASGTLGVYLFLGNGDGTFQAPRYIAVSAPFSMASVVAADMNGDGKADIILSGETFLVLLGYGDGTFHDPISSGAGGTYLVTADFNHDDVPDIAALDPTGVGDAANLVILLGKRNGTFSLGATYRLPNGAQSIAVGDVNGDKKIDLAVGGAQTVSVFLGNGDGTFQTAQEISTSIATAVAIGDVNGDGLGDMVVAGKVPSGVSTSLVLISKGDGTFEAPIAYTTDAYPIFVALADFNHDGRLDIAASDSAGGVSILLNAGKGAFSHAAAVPAGHFAFGIASADFNGDGLPDLAVTDNINGAKNVSILLNQGNDKFGPPSAIALPGTSNGIVAGDFNNDGKLDIATTFTSAGVAVALGNGDGTFQTVTVTPVSMSQSNIVEGDFNGDGKLDLVTAGTGGISVLIGNGDGSFQPAVKYPFPEPLVALFTADLNGDGTLDLVAAGSAAKGNIYIVLGNGDGTFQPFKAAMQIGFPASSIAAGDFNRDGKLDLALAGNVPHVSSALVAMGNGDGSFQTPVSYFAGFSSYHIVVGDFDNDGKLDLAVSNSSNENVGVLTGNGDGTFQPVSLFGAAASPGSLLGVDLTQNGQLDLVAGCGTSGVCLLLNTTRP